MNRQPKYKRELRQAIIENINATKNSVVLKNIYILSDILRRGYDGEECETLTDNEWEVLTLFNEIIFHKDSRKLRSVSVFVNGFLNRKKKVAQND